MAQPTHWALVRTQPTFGTSGHNVPLVPGAVSESDAVRPLPESQDGGTEGPLSQCCRKSVLHAQWPAFCSGCPFGEESLSGALAERVWQPGAVAKRADLEGLGAISK